jgi:polar amino acid transport system substrate-binding protein
MPGRLITILSAFAVAAIATAPSAFAQTLENVLERGKIVVGVKADYRPWGFRDESGNIIGMEPDLAQDVADRLGVELELVPVVASNRMQFLEQGKIDLMIATMSDKEERRKVVGIVQPPYYASGTNVLASEEANLQEWQDLEGKPVCGIQGAWYNDETARRYGAEIVAFQGTAEVYTALRQGRCVAFVYDDSAIMSQLSQEGKWDGYAMPLPSIDVTPWGVAVKKDELDQAFGRFMSGVIFDWHASGRLIELEKEWGIQPTDYLQEMHAKFADWMKEES